MMLWVYTLCLAVSFAAPFYLGWRTLGEHKVTKREARIYTLAIFTAAFLLIGLANLGHYYMEGEPNFGATG